MIACSVVTARIDYCNSLLTGVRVSEKTETSCRAYRTEQLASFAMLVVASHRHMTYLPCFTGFRSVNESTTSSPHCVSKCINYTNIHIYLLLYQSIYHNVRFGQLQKNCRNARLYYAVAASLWLHQPFGMNYL